MATRSGTSYKKRQKELARQDKQREKAARRAQRRLEKRAFASEGEAATRRTEQAAAGNERTE